MFRSHITKPVRWSLPLAALGVLGAGLWYLRPVEIDVDGVALDCRDLMLFAADGVDVVEECRDGRRERFIVSGLILLITALPFLLVVLRGFLWAADTIAELSEDLRRLREERERDRG